MERIAVLARVTGRVQGVFFRAWTRDKALELGLSGWVRNEPDGSVTALVAGPKSRVESLIDELWKGPPSARVANVEVETVADDSDSATFSIVR